MATNGLCSLAHVSWAFLSLQVILWLSRIYLPIPNLEEKKLYTVHGSMNTGQTGTKFSSVAASRIPDQMPTTRIATLAMMNMFSPFHLWRFIMCASQDERGGCYTTARHYSNMASWPSFGPLTTSLGATFGHFSKATFVHLFRWSLSSPEQWN